jgi:nucleotide-binding universal stress UspA family protein
MQRTMKEVAMFTRILVPTDFSQPSDVALDYAREVANKFGASLHLLHVIETPVAVMSPEVGIVDSPELRAQLFEDARDRLQRRITPNDRTHHAATTEIVWGTSAHSIVTYATERGMDLIVMGTHGRGGVAHLLMGSVAEKVVRHAPCPVMTVRQTPAHTVRVPEPLETVWIQAGG